MKHGVVLICILPVAFSLFLSLTQQTVITWLSTFGSQWESDRNRNAAASCSLSLCSPACLSQWTLCGGIYCSSALFTASVGFMCPGESDAFPTNKETLSCRFSRRDDTGNYCQNTRDYG